jgi:hypothetical protein
MLSTQDALQALNFHDSEIMRVELNFASGHGRSATLDLHYYDWEGNAARREVQPNSPWLWRALRIQFAYVAVFEYAADDLINSANVIDTVEWGQGLAPILAREKNVSKQFTRYESPLLVDASRIVSMKFATQNFSESREGYFLIIGTDVTVSWDAFTAPRGQVHTPLAST